MTPGPVVPGRLPVLVRLPLALPASRSVARAGGSRGHVDYGRKVHAELRSQAVYKVRVCPISVVDFLNRGAAVVGRVVGANGNGG